MGRCANGVDRQPGPNKGPQRSALWTFIVASAIALASKFAATAPASAQSLDFPPAREVSVCTVVPEGAPCWASQQRLNEAYAARDAAFANASDCAGILAARNLFPDRTREAFELQGLWVSCRTVEVQAELAALRGPDQRPDPNANGTAAAPAAPPASTTAQRQAPAPQGFITLFDGPLETAPEAANPQILFAMPVGGSQSDPYSNYKAYNREESAVETGVRRPGDPWDVARDGVETNARRPGEPWDIVREGVPIGVTRLEDSFDISDAGSQLQMASIQLEQDRLRREAEAREAARRAEQARREAAERAEYERQQQYRMAELERQERREERERKQRETEMWLGIASDLLGAYNAGKGYTPPPAPTLPGYGSYGGGSGYPPAAPQVDYARQACDQRIQSAANELAGARLGSGACQASRDAVSLYTRIEQAYSGCEQYYRADYMAAVQARRDAEAIAASSCTTGGTALGGSARSKGGSRPDDRYSCTQIGQLAQGLEERCDSAGRRVALCFSDTGWVLQGNYWACAR